MRSELARIQRKYKMPLIIFIGEKHSGTVGKEFTVQEFYQVMLPTITKTLVNMEERFRLGIIANRKAAEKLAPPPESPPVTGA